MKINSRSAIISILTGLSLILGIQAFGFAAQAFEEYTNLNLKFSTMLPRLWKSTVIQKGDQNWLIFNGPQGTDEFETNIRFQVVLQQSQDTLEEQASELERIWSNEPGYKHLSRETGRLSGKPAIRLVGVLQERVNKRVWKLEYFITQRDPYYYVIGYEAPLELYEKHRYVLDKSIATFRFVDPPASQTTPGNRRIYDIHTAQDLRQGNLVGITRDFPGGIPKVVVWFRFQDIPPGSELHSVWYFLRDGKEQKIVEAKAIAGSASDQGNFSLEMPPGKSLPAGEYRVDLLTGNELLGNALFRIQPQ